MTRRLRLAVLAGLATFLLLAGTVGATAYWVTAQSALSGSATAATISATLTPSTSTDLTATYQYTGSPSPYKVGMLTYVNTGTSPVATTLTATGNGGTFGGQIAVSLWSTTAATCPTTPPGTGVTTGTLAALPALPAEFSSVAVGATLKLCVATRVTATLATTQGSTITPVFTLTGRVGTNWSTAATSTFTQSVWRLAAPATPTCAPGSNATVNLSWPHVPGTTSYTIYREDGVTTAKTVTVSGTPTTITTNLTAADLGYTLVGSPRAYQISVRGAETTYNSTSLHSPRIIYLTSLLNLGLVPGLGCTA